VTGKETVAELKEMVLQVLKDDNIKFHLINKGVKMPENKSLEGGLHHQADAELTGTFRVRH
jgi:hypothetical protein